MFIVRIQVKTVNEYRSISLIFVFFCFHNLSFRCIIFFTAPAPETALQWYKQWNQSEVYMFDCFATGFRCKLHRFWFVNYVQTNDIGLKNTILKASIVASITPQSDNESQITFTFKINLITIRMHGVIKIYNWIRVFHYNSCKSMIMDALILLLYDK